MSWRAEELTRLDAARELEIATARADGTTRDWTPIWVVTTGGGAYVRTWHRRQTGWYGDATARPTARVRVPGLEADVSVHDVGAGEQRAAVDAAYRAKYGGSAADRMAGDEAAAATLRLDRSPGSEQHHVTPTEGARS